MAAEPTPHHRLVGYPSGSLARSRWDPSRACPSRAASVPRRKARAKPLRCGKGGMLDSAERRLPILPRAQRRALTTALEHSAVVTRPAQALSRSVGPSTIFTTDHQLVPHRRVPAGSACLPPRPLRGSTGEDRPLHPHRIVSPVRHPHQGRRATVSQPVTQHARAVDAQRRRQHAKSWRIHRSEHGDAARVSVGGHHTRVPAELIAGTKKGHIRDSERPGSCDLPGLSAPARQRR